jgi:tRNA-specific 2-thiouridylase
VFDLKNEYKTYVISYFKEEYLRGRTPNPCIICNHKLKFGFLLKKAEEAGLSFDFFATGHYARLEKNNDRFFLKKALDKRKDQSYFLMGLKKEQLRNLMFPLGAYRKKETREMARKAGLEIADKTESQDFIAGGDYSTLFADKNIQPGEIVDETGKVLGVHKGITHYTIGQRKGLGVSSSKPLYVLRIDAQNNKIVLTDKAGMFSSGLIASDLNLLTSDSIKEPTKISAKIRQNHKEAPAILYPIGKNEIKLIFDEPQLAVTPGQFVAFYDNDIVLGGGVIKEAC